MPAPVTAIVESATQISPNFIRIVFTGPELKVVGSDTPLYDQRIKLIFPTPANPYLNSPKKDSGTKNGPNFPKTPAASCAPTPSAHWSAPKKPPA